LHPQYVTTVAHSGPREPSDRHCPCAEQLPTRKRHCSLLGQSALLVQLGPASAPPDELPLEEPPLDEPPLEDPPLDEPPLEDPPLDDPPLDDPPLEDPPLDDPPGPPSVAPTAPPEPHPSPVERTKPRIVAEAQALSMWFTTGRDRILRARPLFGVSRVSAVPECVTPRRDRRD
jgi:hypothetical protein